MDIGREHTISFLMTVADHYATLSPAVSRSVMSKAESMKSRSTDIPTPDVLTCRRCSSVFRPTNSKVRLRSRPSASKSVLKSLRKKSLGKPLCRLQHQSIKHYQLKQNNMVIFCKTCENLVKVAFATKPVKLAFDTPICKKISKSQKKKLKQERKLLLSGDDSGIGSSPSIATPRNSFSSPAINPIVTSTPLNNSCINPASKIAKDPPVNPFSGIVQTRKSMQEQSRYKPRSTSHSMLSNSDFLRQSLEDSSTSSSKEELNLSKSQLKRRKKKDKNVHNILQKMISDDKRETSSNSSLHSFLNSL